MDFLSFLPDSFLGWANVAGLAVACASGVAAALARLTKNTVDDDVAGWLESAHDFLAKLGLHGATLEQKRFTATAAQTAADLKRISDLANANRG